MYIKYLGTFAADLATKYAESDDHYKSNNATKHDSSYSSATPEKYIKYTCTHAYVRYNLITGILYRSNRPVLKNWEH